MRRNRGTDVQTGQEKDSNLSNLQETNVEVTFKAGNTIEDRIEQHDDTIIVCIEFFFI